MLVPSLVILFLSGLFVMLGPRRGALVGAILLLGVMVTVLLRITRRVLKLMRAEDQGRPRRHSL